MLRVAPRTKARPRLSRSRKVTQECSVTPVRSLISSEFEQLIVTAAWFAVRESRRARRSAPRPCSPRSATGSAVTRTATRSPPTPAKRQSPSSQANANTRSSVTIPAGPTGHSPHLTPLQKPGHDTGRLPRLSRTNPARALRRRGARRAEPDLLGGRTIGFAQQRQFEALSRSRDLGGRAGVGSLLARAAVTPVSSRPLAVFPRMRQGQRRDSFPARCGGDPIASACTGVSCYLDVASADLAAPAID